MVTGLSFSWHLAFPTTFLFQFLPDILSTEGGWRTTLVMIGCVWQVWVWMVSWKQVLPTIVALPLLVFCSELILWMVPGGRIADNHTDDWWLLLAVCSSQVLYLSHCLLSPLSNKYTTVQSLTACLVFLITWPFLGLSPLVTPDREGKDKSSLVKWWDFHSLQVHEWLMNHCWNPG